MSVCILSMVIVALVFSESSGQSGDNLYFVDYSFDKLYRLNLADQRRVELSVTLSEPSAMVIDPSLSTIFIANTHLAKYNTSKYITKYHINSHSTDRLSLPSSSRIYGMAVDPISGLIFYTDGGEGNIRALNTDLSYSHIIIGDLVLPGGIAVDPIRRIIFWTEQTSTFPHIGRAQMDGSHRRTIVVHGIVEPSAIALDRPESKIYWCDAVSNTIERSGTDGSNRETVARLSDQYHTPISVNVDNNHIYWSLLRKGTIYRTQKQNLPNRDTIGPRYAANSTDYRSLSLTSTQIISGTTMCSGSPRGGCQHICLPAPTSRVCRCSDGYQLQSDGTSCKESPYKRGILLGDVNTHQIINIDLDDDVTKVFDHTWHDGPRGIAYDPDNKQIFWVDYKRRGVFRSCLPQPCLTVVRMYSDPKATPLDIIIDKQEGMLYVTDNGLDRIIRMSFSGLQEEVVYQRGTSPRFMALDTTNRIIYWYEYSSTSSAIKKTNTNYWASPEVFLDGLDTVGGLAFDPKAHRLFWTDYSNNNVESISADGRSREILFDSPGRNDFFGLTLGDGKLYFSDRNKFLVYELDVKTKTTKQYAKGRTRRAVGIAYYNLDPVSAMTPTPIHPAEGGGSMNPQADPTPSAKPSGLDRNLIIVG